MATSNTLLSPPATHKALECPRCHYVIPRPIKAAQGKFLWEKLLQTQTGAIFFDCWTFRFLRRGIRDITGTVLDKSVPINANWVNFIKRLATPKANFYEKNCWDYIDIYQRFKNRQSVSIFDYVRKKLINLPLSGTLCCFRDGEIFRASARMTSSGFTWFRAGRRTYRTYQQTHDKAKTTKTGVVEVLKWTFGTEISSLGAEIGKLLSPKRGQEIGFLIGTLCSAVFDTVLERTINPD